TGIAALLSHLAVPAGIPGIPHGIRVRDGLGAVPDHPGVHGDPHPYLEALGPLPGRLPIATTLERPARTAPITGRPVPPRERRRRILFSVANHSLAIALGACFIIPFVFVVLNSLMPASQVFS